MLRFFPTAFIFFVIIVCFKPAESIRCYVCRSDDNSDCEEGLGNSLVQDCPTRPNAIGEYCRTIKQQLYFKDEESVTTIRECAYEKSPKQCYKSKWAAAAYQETCECEEDLCNASPNIAKCEPITLVTLVILTMYTYLYFM